MLNVVSKQKETVQGMGSLYSRTIVSRFLDFENGDNKPMVNNYGGLEALALLTSFVMSENTLVNAMMMKIC